MTDPFDLERDVNVYEWWSGRTVTVGHLEVELASRDWALFVVGPPAGPSVRDVGDGTKYVVVESTR